MVIMSNVLIYLGHVLQTTVNPSEYAKLVKGHGLRAGKFMGIFSLAWPAAATVAAPVCFVLYHVSAVTLHAPLACAAVISLLCLQARLVIARSWMVR